jgi:hypothetical protein
MNGGLMDEWWINESGSRLAATVDYLIQSPA